LSLKQPRDKLDFRGDLDIRTVLDDVPGTRSKEAWQRRIVTPVLIICALIAVLVTLDYWFNAGRIYPGVEVGGVSLGYKTHEEARETIENQLAGALREIKLTGPEEITLSSERMGMNLDVRATVDRAYAVGRQGGILERLGDRMEATWDTVRVSPVVDYQREVVHSRIENLAAQLNKEPEDAYVSIEGSEAKVVESREGYAVDVAATLANVDEAINDMSGEAKIAAEVLEPVVVTPAAQTAAEKAEEVMSDEPVVLRAEGEEWELSPGEIGRSLSFVPEGGELRVGLDQERLRKALSVVINDLTVEPVEAGYQLTGNSISVTKSQTGKEVEEKKLFADLEGGLFTGKRDYEVPVLTAEPNLTTEEAEKLKPTDLLGTYRTSYTLSSDKSPARVENLQIASNAISGTILAPGEVFSANEILAPLNYNETKVIVLGKEEKADGGGLCQVSSTLYMAANYAGLEIVERHPHQAQLPYIRPGLDATVWFDALDMKFKNTTDGYLLIQESVGNDGFVYASIYGRPTGKEVEMDSEPEYLGSDYSEWITYKKVTENGKVVEDGVLYKTTYRPLVDEKGKTIPPNDPYLNIAPVNY
jgi:vancomycin resistance protein YoaR